MKKLPLILLVFSLWLGACSRPLPQTPTSQPTEASMKHTAAAQTPSTHTPTAVKVAMATMTPTAATPPTATARPSATSAPTPTPLPPSPEGFITDDLVNLRSGPDTGYAIVGQATLSQTVQILGRDSKGEWWQICCLNPQKESAWVSAEFVQTTQPFTNVAASAPVIEFPHTLTGVVSGDQINLRSGPGTQYELLGEIDLGKTVELVGRSKDNNWWQIKYPAAEDNTAWIYTQYVLTNFDPADAERRLPAIEAPPPAAPSAPVTATSSFTLSVTAVISGDAVNLRKGPGTTYARAGRVTQDQSVQIVGKNTAGTWHLLCCAGKDNSPAWISAEFTLVDKPKDLLRLPVITDTEKFAGAAQPPESAAPPAASNASDAPSTITPNSSEENALPPAKNFPPPGGTNPLTGLPLASELRSQRPIIVCINNDPQARPQHGISQADVMYEYLMESYYITRFSGVFYGESPAEIGPVRSARLINYYMGALYNAPLFCSGASDQVRYLLKNIAPFPYFDIDLDDSRQVNYARSVTTDYRTRLRTDMEHLRQWTQDWGIEKPANLRGFTFGDLPSGGQPAAEINIPYIKRTGTQVRYLYSPNAGTYLRFMGDAPHLDANTGQQVGVENVIVQYVHHEVTDMVEDSLGSKGFRMNLFGSGKAILFRDGLAFPVTWRSQTQGDTPHFFDQSGKEIPLKPGHTWISIVPEDYDKVTW